MQAIPQPEGHHLAQVNVARFKVDPPHAVVEDFESHYDRINRIADGSPGFVWRIPPEMEPALAAAVAPGDARISVNMSVWDGVEGFRRFVWKTLHRVIFEKRADWFVPLRVRFALWWLPAGQVPDPLDAAFRLRHLEAHGESATAFGWTLIGGAPHGDAQITPLAGARP